MTTRANNQFPWPDFHRRDKQPYRLRTKDTKVSDIDFLKLLNFVLFVTFVVMYPFGILLAAAPHLAFVVKATIAGAQAHPTVKFS